MKKSLLIFPLMMILIIGGCSLKEPGTPRWQVEMTIPIADRVYSLEDIIDDSTEVDSSGNWVSQNGDTLIFNFADSIDVITIENELKYDAFDETIETYVGLRTVNPPGMQTAFYLLTDLAPELQPFVGQTVPVPQFNFDAPAQEIIYPEYDWVIVASGDVTVTVTNNLPVPLENISIDVYGSSPNILVVHVDIPGPLAPGESESQEDWALPTGQEIDNVMEIYVSGSSPGSAAPVLIGEDDNIRVDVEISELEVESARAHIPTQDFDEDTTFSLLETDTLITAVIKQGYLDYSITNNTELINTVHFTLPDFTHNGEPFTQEFTIDPNDTHSITGFNLSDYQFSRPQGDNQIQALVEVNILDTADPLYNLPDDFVEINQYQMVSTEFNVSSLYFSYFEGFLDTVELDIEQDPLELEDIPEGLDNLNLDYANVDIRLTNTIGVQINANLTLKAFKDDILMETLNIPPLQIPAGDTTNPGVLDTTITGIEALINVIPDLIQIEGVAYIAGEVAVGEWQWIAGEFLIYTPFALQIGESTLEPEIAEIDQGFDNMLNQVDLTLNLISHMPLSGEAFILASYDSADFENIAGSQVDTFIYVALPTAVVGDDGYVISPGESTVEQTLNLDQLEMFAGADEDSILYIKTFITILSTEGEIVRMKPTDYISVGASAHVVVDADFDDEDETGGGN
ncbi:MAG: hypothetical protein HQ591_06040 [candidate division Zixibacteria bacterium]|nr:hypothetical protein [Candidatus Tariuqbacter arcticus]